jgi:nucleotide-binding universal stress UspA family protein
VATNVIPMAVRTILVPTDFSDSANAALDWAKDLAAALEARIVLLHVVDLQYQMMPSGLLVVPTPIPGSIVRRAKTQAGAALDAVAAKVPAVERRLIRQGHARDVTLAVADEVRADVIVMGTHGRRGVEHFFIGSVAEYVVRHARVPVMTVRAAVPSAGRTSSTGQRSSPGRRSPSARKSRSAEADDGARRRVPPTGGRSR